MNTATKKGLIFTIIAYISVWLLVGVFRLSGKTTDSPVWALVTSACMFMPLVAAVITQILHREPVLGGIGISWKINRWWFVAWLLPVAMTIGMIAVSCLMPGTHFMKESPLLMDALDKVNSVLPEGKQLSYSVLLISQIANGFIGGITINALFAFGEEAGWRGYLLRQFSGKNFLLTAVIIGALWGLWHAPLILMGHNFPAHPVTGVFMMIVFCICLAPIAQFIRVKSGSVIAAAIFHGSFNAFATFVPVFIDGTNDLLTSPAGLAGIIACLIALACLHLTDRSVLSSTLDL
jgi:membrane protease YdiL (CAAX protease family)